MTFLVSLLRIELGYALAIAGTIYACGQMGAVAGRLMGGAIAGRWIAPTSFLMLVGFSMAATSVALGASNPTWPVVMVGVAAVLAGVAGGGWLGVCLSECARLAPSDQVGLVTGGVLFFHYLTLIVTPLAFAAFAARLGYGWAFIAVGVVTVSGLLPLVLKAPEAGSLALRDTNKRGPQQAAMDHVAGLQHLHDRAGGLARVRHPLEHRLVQVRVEGLVHRRDRLDAMLFQHRLQLAVGQLDAFGQRGERRPPALASAGTESIARRRLSDTVSTSRAKLAAANLPASSRSRSARRRVFSVSASARSSWSLSCATSAARADCSPAGCSAPGGEAGANSSGVGACW